MEIPVCVSVVNCPCAGASDIKQGFCVLHCFQMKYVHVLPETNVDTDRLNFDIQYSLFYIDLDKKTSPLLYEAFGSKMCNSGCLS